jgi:hypothetical protein
VRTSIRCGGCDRGVDATPILVCEATNFALCLECVAVARDSLVRGNATPARPRQGGHHAEPVRCKFCVNQDDGRRSFFEFGGGCVCHLCLALAMEIFAEENAP